MSAFIKKTGILSVLVATAVIAVFATVQVASAVSTFAATSWTTAAQDLTIEAGATTAKSLILISDEDTTDAINIDATAGGIDIDAVGAAGQDIVITNTGGSIGLSATEAIADAINIDATAGGIAIDAVGGAALDIIITNTGGSIGLSATEDATDAINIDATAGGIDIDAVGAAGLDIVLTNTGGSVSLVATEAAADAIVLNASTAAGGIDITSNADIDITTTGEAGEDITITNTGGSVNINSTENAAAAITLLSNGGTAETITITNTQGTAAGSIALASTAGGVTITGATAILIGDATIGLTYFEDTEAVTADNVLTVAESGNTFYVSGALATSTLPAVASSNGVVFRFVVGATLTGSHIISTSDASSLIEGSLSVANAVVDCAAEDAITFVDAANLGDFVEVRSNGTNWFVTTSNGLASGKITCTAAGA